MTKNLHWPVTVLVALLSVGAASGISQADFLFFDSPGAFQSTLVMLDYPAEEQVLFHGPGTDPGPGLTVTGRTNMTNQLVDVTADQLVEAGPAARRVEAVDTPYTTAIFEPHPGSLPWFSLSFFVNTTETTGGR